MTLDLQGDPACWDWPLPDVFAFRDDKAAEAFLRWWNRLCAICEADENLVLEHDHSTGLVRGYACPRCNGAEAHATDPGDVFARYRRRNPASILGVQVQYSSARLPMKPTSARRRVVVLRHKTTGGAEWQARAARESREQSDRRIANNVRAARIAAGYSQRQLAQLVVAAGMRMSQQALVRIESGQRKVFLGEAVMLASIFEKDIEEMFGDPPAAESAGESA